MTSQMFSRFTFCHNFKNEIEKLRKHRKYMNTMKFENYFFIVLCIIAKIETTHYLKTRYFCPVNVSYVRLSTATTQIMIN